MDQMVLMDDGTLAKSHVRRDLIAFNFALAFRH